MSAAATSNPTVAGALGKFATDLAARPDALPAATRDEAAQRVLDSLACMILGLRVPPALTIAKLASGLGHGNVRVIGAERRTSATGAAFSHGSLAQSFEMDDLGVYVHPGACIVPAALAALDETQRPVSGPGFLAAVVAGYEATIRLSEAVGPGAELDIGWHTPAFHGAVGAAVTASMILGLSRDRTEQAIAMSGDLAGSGLMFGRLGSDLKRVHCGRGAEGGVLCALLSQANLETRRDIFEHPVWGYGHAMTASDTIWNASHIYDRLGEDYVAFSRTGLKYHSFGAEVLGMIDSINLLRKQHGFSADAVEKVRVHTTDFFYNAEPHKFPESATQIHFCSEYGIAMALLNDIRPVYEGSGVLDLVMSGYTRPGVREMFDRVEHVIDDAMSKANPYQIDSRIEVFLKDGTRLDTATGYVAGATSKGTMKFQPMKPELLRKKFMALSDRSLEPDAQEQLADDVLGLTKSKDARVIWSGLGKARVPVAAA